jgi:hypothetical protein
MAYAMMGGIIVGTLLTLLFLPALYVAWFRIQPDQGDRLSTHETADETAGLAPDIPSSERMSPENEAVPVLETQS